MMWIGLSLLLGPLSVLASVIPFLGNLLGAGTAFVSFVFAVVLTSSQLPSPGSFPAVIGLIAFGHRCLLPVRRHE